MAAEWTDKTLEEIAAPTGRPFAMGPFGSNIRSENYRASGVPVIRGLNLTDVGGPPFIDSEFVFLSDDKAAELSSSNAFPGDLVFVAQGTVGRVGLVPQRGGHRRYVLSQNLMKATVDPNVADSQFVFYYFRSQAGQHEILSRVNPTGVPCISRPLSSLRSFRVSLPPLPEQRAIAHILGTLDDKIELNRRMNETLEAMARALFKSWFVDFDPVRLKAESRPGGTGLPEPLADLFPDSFEDSELGEVPKGWEVLPLGDLLDLAYGKALKEENRQPGIVPVFGSNGQVGWHNEALVTGPGIIVGRKGNPGIVTWAPTDFFCIDTTFYVVPRERGRRLYFLFYALLAQDLAALGADSAVPGLNRNLAYMSKQQVPNAAILDAFDAIARPLFAQVHHLGEQSRTLAALRDTLLPKLLSGKLRVPAAAKLVEAHA